MKIVVSGYVGKKITGIGRNLINLLNSASGQNLYVIYTNFDMENSFRFTNPNVIVKTYSVSKNSSLKNLLWTTFIFPFLCLKERANCALIPNFTFLILKFVKTIVIMHDLIEFNIPNKFSPLKMFYRTKLADPITARIADKIITVSENSKRDIIHFLKVNPHKIEVVYNGVDSKLFTKMGKDEANKVVERLNIPEKFILYVGTIDHPGKNAMGVIKAFEKLCESNKYDGNLVLAGMPGSGFENVKHYVQRSSYKNRIYVVGYVSDPELVALYSLCQLFCFLSLYEGFGIPPLEAIACGAKVLVSDKSSLPEVVGDVGRCVDPEDTDAISQYMFDCLMSNDVGQVARKKHLEKFQWPLLSKKFEEALL